MLVCSVYGSKSQQGYYLYVEKKQALSAVPEALQKRLYPLHCVTHFLLTNEKTLAHAKADNVIESIVNQGFYLQLPVTEEADSLMQAISLKNNKL